MKNASYTKKGPGRCHNFTFSGRAFDKDEARGNKLQRKIQRKHVGLKHITKTIGDYKFK